MQAEALPVSPIRQGMADAIPLFTGYIPVAVSFGLIAVQSGLNAWEATLISALVYAGASQFLFLAMMSAGAEWWLIVAMTLLVNARFVVYGPTLAAAMDRRKRWVWLSHGLSDQVFALAHARLPDMAEQERFRWYAVMSILAWVSWVVGTLLGGLAGAELVNHWPSLGDAMTFALPALSLILVAPRFTSLRWSIALTGTIAVAMLFKLAGYANLAIPLAACAGSMLFFGLASATRPASLTGGRCAGHE